MPGNVLGTRWRCVQSCDRRNRRAGRAAGSQRDNYSLVANTDGFTRRRRLL